MNSPPLAPIKSVRLFIIRFVTIAALTVLPFASVGNADPSGPAQSASPPPGALAFLEMVSPKLDLYLMERSKSAADALRPYVSDQAWQEIQNDLGDQTESTPGSTIYASILPFSPDSGTSLCDNEVRTHPCWGVQFEIFSRPLSTGAPINADGAGASIVTISIDQTAAADFQIVDIFAGNGEPGSAGVVRQ